MTTRSLIYVGLVLIGIHLLVSFLVALPSTGFLLSGIGSIVGPTPSAAREVAVNTVATLACQLFVGLVLVLGAPRLATVAAARLERADVAHGRSE